MTSIFSDDTISMTKFPATKLSFSIFSVSPKVRIEHYSSQATTSVASGVNHEGQEGTVLPKVLTVSTAPPEVQPSEGHCRVLRRDIS